MPRYDYRCPICEKTVEVFHGIQEEHLEFCPMCVEPMNKLVGNPPFKFKNDLKAIMSDGSKIGG